MKYYAVIVAGGSGNRMQTDMPKQFLKLNGRPILFYTIEAFHNSEIGPEIILVLNQAHHEYWQKLCLEYAFNIPHTLIEGGKERFDSVKNGLKEIRGLAVVAIHDAVRPLVSNQIITESYRIAEEKGSAVTAVNSRDSVREVNGDTTQALNRENIYLIQTPQTFKSQILTDAYEQSYQKEFTDDASVVEKMGHQIYLITGSSKNIKITFPEDLIIAEHFLNNFK